MREEEKIRKQPNREWALLRRRDHFKQAQKEFRGVLNRYQNSLFPQDKKRQGFKLKPISDLLKNLHEHSWSKIPEDVSSAPTWETILDTEASFRDMGKLMKQMIALAARLPPDEEVSDTRQSFLAEELLRALIQLRTDRAHLVRVAEQSRVSDKKDYTWIGWLKQVFSLEEEKEESPQQEPKLIHQSKSFGPTKRQFLDAIMSIRREAELFKWEPESWGDPTMLDVIRVESKEKRGKLMVCGHRMSALLDLSVQEGIHPLSSMTKPCIETFLEVGSLESAGFADRIYTEICEKRVPRENFHLLIKAYGLAARMEEDPAKRAYAATRAQVLLQEREQYQLADIYSSTPGSNDLRQEAYTLVLEALRNAGWTAIPDMIDQAEKLLKLYLGEKLFHAVVEYKEQSRPPNVDLQVFESLVYMYAFKTTPKRYMRAKNIVKCAEDVLMETSSTPRPNSASKKDESVNFFPNVMIYNAILAATRTKINAILRKIGRLGEKESEVERLRQVLKAEALYGSSFLDRMTLHPSSFPDIKTFECLFDIWIDAALPESGKHADEILSRMCIWQGAGRSFSSQHNRLYSKALQCWVKSAENSFPGALQRTLRVLDKMEAQSGIRRTAISAVDSYSDTEKKIFALVYDKDDPESYRAAYNAGIYVCSLSLEDPEAALEAAFDLYNRMMAAGIMPDEETFTNLLSCCTRLLPQETDRQEELAKTVIAFAGDNGMNVNELSKKMKREIIQRRASG